MPARRRRRWRRRLLVAGLLLLLAGVGAYLGLTADQARSHLERAKADVSTVRTALLTGNDASARAALAAASLDIAKAHSQTGGPVWWAAARVPWLGAPLKTVRQLTSTAQRLVTGVLPGVVDSASALSPDRLNVGPSRIDVAPLRAAAPTLANASAATAAAEKSVERTPSKTWLSPVDNGRRDFANLLDQLRRQLDDAAAAAQLMPAMLGADGPRNYLMVFENEAESRGLGGLPGAFAILHADRGAIAFTKFGNDTEIGGPVHVDLGTQWAARYTQYGAQDSMQNTDMSPHFPYAAQLWLAMWAKRTGQRLDGAIATDPTALGYLLNVTGPTRLPDGTSVTSSNVVELTEAAAYQRIRDRDARRAFFIAVAKAAASHVADQARGRSRALTKALGHAIGERRLLVWSAHPDEEAVLTGLPLGGVLPQSSAPFTALVVNNAAGSKLDYYLDRSLVYSPGYCHGSRRTVVVHVTLSNTAPRSGLPPYVVVRNDRKPRDTVAGSNRVLATLYATQGAQLTGVTIDGRPGQATVEHELGHLVLTVDVELAPGQARDLVFGLDEPRSNAPVSSVIQPMTRPMQEQILPAIC